MGPDDITPPSWPSQDPAAPAAAPGAPAGSPLQGQPPAAASAPVASAHPNEAINSMEDAQSVARLIKEGKITGEGKAKAMADLRAFDNSVQHEKNYKGKNSVENMGVGEKLARGFAAGAETVGRGLKQVGSELLDKLPTDKVSPQEMAAYTPKGTTPEQAQSQFQQAQQGGISQDLRQQNDQANKSNAPLLATKAGSVGNILGETAATSPAALIPGANTSVGAALIGGGLGAIRPVGTTGSRETNAVEGAIGGVVGQKVGQLAGYIGGKFASKISPELAAKAVTPNGVTPDAARAVAQGYRLPPSMAKAKPGIVEDMVEGIGGKVRTEQAFSIPNQANTNRLARNSIGLGAGDKVSLNEVLDQRRAAGQVYQEVRNLTENAFPGFKNVRIKPNAEFQGTMDNITGTFKNYAKRFPSIFKNDQVNRMVRDINKPMTTDEAVQLSMKLREDATANYRAPKGTVKALGKAQKRAADAIDKLVESHLKAFAEGGNNTAISQAQRLIAGKDPSFRNLYDQYRKARQIIARTYDVEKVLDKHTGNIDAEALARLSARRPLSGELAEIADFGAKFEGVARVPTRRGSRLGPSVSKSEIGVAAISSAMGHAHSMGKLATIGMYTGAPWAARKYMLSDLAQHAIRPRTPAGAAANVLGRIGTVVGAHTLQDEEDKKQ